MFFSKKHSSLISIILLLLAIFAVSLYLPSTVPALGMAVLLLSLAVSIHSIFQKHKQAENPRAKIARDVLILVFTLLFIIFLGGLAGLFAAQYAGSRAAGFILAMLVSFAVGYAVRWGVRRLVRG